MISHIYKPNQLIIDDFGRPSGVLVINKPSSFTSHDVVNKTRRLIGTKKVGHAGALDPFATGVLITVVGKATKLSDDFMTLEKEYEGEILFGVSTDSQDPEGEILKVENINFTTDELEPKLQAIVKQFSEGYEQFVPVYSSIKIDGQKLRVLARKYDSFETYFEGDKKFVRFFNNEDGKERIVELPKHKIDFKNIEILAINQISLVDLDLENKYIKELHDKILKFDEKAHSYKFFTLKVKAACPKGTYIRQLAEDIGASLESPLPAMLIALKRTRIGEYTIENSVELDEVANLKH